MRRHLGLIAALVSLIGCASNHRGNNPDSERENAGVAAAMRTVAEYRGSSYKIAPTDVVSVNVYPDQSLSRKARVDTEGTISLPLIGTATVAGFTVAEVERTLAERLSAYLVKSHVSVVVEEHGNRQMFVLGEVKNPGTYAIPAGAPLTVLQAVSTAGGFTKIAAPTRARILRYVDGKSVERVIDLKAVAKGEQSEKDFLLEPNDVVYVPQSLF